MIEANAIVHAAIAGAILWRIIFVRDLVSSLLLAVGLILLPLLSLLTRVYLTRNYGPEDEVAGYPLLQFITTFSTVLHIVAGIFICLGILLISRGRSLRTSR